MKHIKLIAVLLVLICLLLSSCGIKKSNSVIANDSKIEDKYTQTVYTAEDMLLSNEDFVFFKLDSFLEDYTPDDGCIVALSPCSSIIYSEAGLTDNGFALSTSRMTAAGDSDIDEFLSSYKVADGYSLRCVEDASSAEADKYVIGSSAQDTNTRITIGAYYDGEAWSALAYDMIAELLGYGVDESKTADIPTEATVLLISAYADENDTITLISVYSGTASVLSSLRAQGYAQYISFIAQAEEAALAAQAASSVAAEETTETQTEAKTDTDAQTTETATV